MVLILMHSIFVGYKNKGYAIKFRVKNFTCIGQYDG